MPGKIFTDRIIALIPQLVAQNVSADEIARQVGCSLSTLRVRCSQLKISLRTPNWKEKRRQTIEAGYAAEELAKLEAEKAALPKAYEAPLKPKPIVKSKRLTIESSLMLSRVAMSLIRQKAEAIGVTEATLVRDLLEALVRDDAFLKTREVA